MTIKKVKVASKRPKSTKRASAKSPVRKTGRSSLKGQPLDKDEVIKFEFEPAPPNAPDAEAAPDAERRAEVSAQIERAVNEVERLVTAKQVVVANLAKHTGLFGSGLFKQADPENENRLGDIKAEIIVAKLLVEDLRTALESLDEAVTAHR